MICLGWCLASLVRHTHGHRTPYFMLTLAILFALIATGDNMACIYFFNIYFQAKDSLLMPNLDEVLQTTTMLATPISVYFLLSSVNTVLRNRYHALCMATDNRRRERNILWHKLLALTMLAFGLAGAGVYLEALVDNYAAMTALAGQNPHNELMRAINDRFLAREELHAGLEIAFSAFAALSTMDVALSLFQLRRAQRLVGVTDKVTKQFAHTVVPLFATYGVCHMIFAIISYNQMPTYEIVQTVIEGETLVKDLLLLLSFSAVVTALLLLSVNPDDWVLRERDHKVNPDDWVLRERDHKETSEMAYKAFKIGTGEF
ncbi:hypothetical protein HWV62_27763 [Athelia sp. TMB]|nr:hypothetical protein HWV62_27763 [Athelia sp. TMB]